MKANGYRSGGQLLQIDERRSNGGQIGRLRDDGLGGEMDCGIEAIAALFRQSKRTGGQPCNHCISEKNLDGLRAI
jgi:hypothetical protein